MDMPYFEISEENLKEQMKLVLRMEKPVLFVLRQNHLSESRWGEMLRVAQARVMELKIIWGVFKNIFRMNLLLGL